MPIVVGELVSMDHHPKMDRQCSQKRLENQLIVNRKNICSSQRQFIQWFSRDALDASAETAMEATSGNNLITAIGDNLDPPGK